MNMDGAGGVRVTVVDGVIYGAVRYTPGDAVTIEMRSAAKRGEGRAKSEEFPPASTERPIP